MTALPGVPVTGVIVPQDSADTYPVIDPKYQLGGWRTELLLADRDAIPSERRRRGMQVYVAETNLIYYLGAGLANADWTAFSSTVTAHIHPISDVVGLQSALDAKAPLASPTFTGVPIVPTAAASTNTTQAASTAFAVAGDTAIVGGAPTNLNTLAKLATAIGGDPAFATTLNTALGLKAPLASPAFTGVPTVPTAANGTNTTQAASCAFVLANAITGSGAPLASPAFTGTPTAPTAAAGTATNQLATTLFSANAIAAVLGGAPGSLDTLGKIATSLGNDPAIATTIANKQPLDAKLTSFVNLATVSNSMIYFSSTTGQNIVQSASFGRGVLGKATGNALRNYVDRGTTPLTDAATIVTDATDANVFTVTIAGNRVLAAPTNLQVGGFYTWVIINDATAGRSVTLDAVFKLPAGVNWTPDTGAGKVNVLSALCLSATQLLVTPVVGYL